MCGNSPSLALCHLLTLSIPPSKITAFTVKTSNMNDEDMDIIRKQVEIMGLRHLVIDPNESQDDYMSHEIMNFFGENKGNIAKGSSGITGLQSVKSIIRSMAATSQLNTKIVKQVQLEPVQLILAECKKHGITAVVTGETQDSVIRDVIFNIRLLSHANSITEVPGKYFPMVGDDHILKFTPLRDATIVFY